MGLDHIQEDLENPYDGIGLDDIHFGEEVDQSAPRLDVAALTQPVEIEARELPSSAG